MLVVLPYCNKDRLLAIKLLEWMAELDGKKTRHNCILMAARTVKSDDSWPVIEAARKAFGIVTHAVVNTLDERPHPCAANTMFKATCEFIAKSKQTPFLWCEPDCTPLVRGWLDAIEDEYVSCGKDFMGCLGLPKDHLTGNAVYPHNAASYHRMFVNDHKPFDCQGGKEVLDKAHITNLIQHIWSVTGTPEGPAFTFNGPESLKILNKGAVLFHRCKDGSLIEALRASMLSKVTATTSEKIDLTVIVTAFRRPELLRSAVESCIKARVPNVIMTITGVTDDMRKAANQLAREHENVRALFHADSVGSNPSWYLGVEAAETKYVAILHDDDLVLPNYVSEISAAIHLGANVIHADASNHECDPYTCSVSKIRGLLPTSLIGDFVSKPGTLSISPIRGVFKRDDLVRWLKLSEGLPKQCYYRPGFLVGNDLLVWLQACREYSHFYNVPVPIVSHGHWQCSTTVKDLAMPKKDQRLFQIYDAVRTWFFSGGKMEPIEVGSRIELAILTIVLDGMPMLGYHLPTLNRLPFNWHWYIVEGVAKNTHCTKWCKPIQARLSDDGTTEILNDLAFHPRISVYRKIEWDGKIEMVNAPLHNIRNDCVLLQMDCDEFWTTDQLVRLVNLFKGSSKDSAMFWCNYYFGPGIKMVTRNCYGNNPMQDWRRAWRFTIGRKFVSHEPPAMTNEVSGFTHAETEAAGLVFDHYGYAFSKQVAFKEKFYGLKDAVTAWKRMQTAVSKRVKLGEFLPWVTDKGAEVSSI